MISFLYKITDQYLFYLSSQIFLKKCILSHLEKSNNILYDNQFGFRKNHSTTHAIITLVEKQYKALDTIYHQILFKESL